MASVLQIPSWHARMAGVVEQELRIFRKVAAAIGETLEVVRLLLPIFLLLFLILHLLLLELLPLFHLK